MGSHPVCQGDKAKWSHETPGSGGAFSPTFGIRTTIPFNGATNNFFSIRFYHLIYE